ncbi:predicted protein [Sclerotinia sclerotiorum 1980 UF-70]|uniref:Uncharacterized protein n=1 Tax=Sclerotinia sclerotiorum (strain ATCC 18683 / 1980 / Ss-1) TaxID=665079 RepID=A7E7K2_SCLS1|nr:predicted protein [Sclerotinia sclerotiorum 1980 UF-70]EDN96354.1 predicted protein [Sclerotinia sclerotiorum 1980 UF-70]
MCNKRRPSRLLEPSRKLLLNLTRVALKHSFILLPYIDHTRTQPVPRIRKYAKTPMKSPEASWCHTTRI